MAAEFGAAILLAKPASILPGGNRDCTADIQNTLEIQSQLDQLSIDIIAQM